MFELVYTSIASRDITKEDIFDILKVAQAFNKENNITGCLLFYKREFLQILEGDRDVVKALYANIVKDPRHNHVTLVIEKETEVRVFDDWSMAYHELTDNNMSDLSLSLFKSNFLSLSSLAKESTLSVKSFWKMSKLMLEQ